MLVKEVDDWLGARSRSLLSRSIDDGVGPGSRLPHPSALSLYYSRPERPVNFQRLSLGVTVPSAKLGGGGHIISIFTAHKRHGNQPSLIASVVALIRTKMLMIY
jgi:hypothetical protein